MNQERAERALKVLQDFRPSEGYTFSIHTWFHRIKEGPECETVCCAAGIIAQDEWINQQGLRLMPADPRCMIPSFDDYEDFGALQKFFGISDDDTRFIFAPGAYYFSGITLDHVIDRFKQVIHAHREA